MGVETVSDLSLIPILQPVKVLNAKLTEILSWLIKRTDRFGLLTLSAGASRVSSGERTSRLNSNQSHQIEIVDAPCALYCSDINGLMVVKFRSVPFRSWGENPHYVCRIRF